jgi:hypothetical protein
MNYKTAEVKDRSLILYIILIFRGDGKCPARIASGPRYASRIARSCSANDTHSISKFSEYRTDSLVMKDMVAVLSVTSLRQNRAKSTESLGLIASDTALSLEGSGFDFRPEN